MRASAAFCASCTAAFPQLRRWRISSIAAGGGGVGEGGRPERARRGGGVGVANNKNMGNIPLSA